MNNNRWNDESDDDDDRGAFLAGYLVGVAFTLLVGFIIYAATGG